MGEINEIFGECQILWRDLESKTLCNLAMVWLSCDTAENTAENFENYKKRNEY